MAETTEAGVQKMAGAGSARSRTADVAAALAAILFLATGIMGVWTAFDQASAWRRLALIAAGMVLMVVIWGVGRVWGERALAWLALGCAPAAGLLGAYFMLSFDWAGNGVKKLPGLYQVGLWIQATRPAVPSPRTCTPTSPLRV